MSFIDTIIEDATENHLEHYGVKGMKWGVRRDKPSSQAIYDARTRNAGRARQLQRQADKLNLAKPGKDQEREAKKFAELEAEFLKSPDRATSLRLTSGEKMVYGILAVGLPGIGTGAAAGAVAARVAFRKAAERQADRLNSGGK